MIEYKGYTGIIEFDSDHRLFTGHVVDLRDVIYFEGDSVESLEASMRRAIDHYLDVCLQRGEEPEKPFSGKLNVRLGPELHRAAVVAASAEGQSLNQWLVQVVESATREISPLPRPAKKLPQRKRSTSSRTTRPK